MICTGLNWSSPGSGMMVAHGKKYNAASWVIVDYLCAMEFERIDWRHQSYDTLSMNVRCLINIDHLLEELGEIL